MSKKKRFVTHLHLNQTNPLIRHAATMGFGVGSTFHSFAVAGKKLANMRLNYSL
jgi:hypothetical protein